MTVSNYPGTTVEISYGDMTHDGKNYLIVDTPGINSLMPMSEDEKVTRDLFLKERPFSVVQVADTKNLKRSLLLTLQIAEMGLPLIMVLNMEDEAMDKGIVVDINKLKTLIGVETVSTIAPQRKGIKDIKSAIPNPLTPTLKVRYESVIEEYIDKISSLLPKMTISRRALSIMILSGDESLKDWMVVNLNPDILKSIESLRDECQSKLKEPISLLISQKRFEVAEEITEKVLRRTAEEGGKLLSFIGSVSMHPVWGIPILLLVLYVLYEFVGVFGAGTLVDFFEEVIFGEYINPMVTKVIELVIPSGIIHEMFVGEYGLVTVALTYAIAIILPITATFFIAFSILEDSGYLPRLAIMSNRLFNLMGLNGKAVLPMVLGLGCGTMAVMTSRILETKKERLIITLLIAFAIPCSAQLGVILGMLGALSFKATLIWAGSVLGVLLFTGYLASKVIKGEKTEFFLEIPPIRRPNLTNIAVKTLGRIEWYLKEAVPLFILGTFILFVFHKLNLIDMLQTIASPVVVTLLGLPEKTTESFVMGFLRRDYGAAGLFSLAEKGMLTPIQSVVSLVTITLFIPCLASLFMIVKERGMKAAISILAIVFPLAFLFGGLLNWILRALNVNL